MRCGGRGRTRVALTYDDSLFTGPAVNPHWPPSYITESIVAPISALWVDEGRAAQGWPNECLIPASTAAQRFAALLHKRGLEVQPPSAGTGSERQRRRWLRSSRRRSRRSSSTYSR